jgi:hypothetical protein
MRTNTVQAVLVTLEAAVTRLGGVDLDGLAHVELLAALRVQHRLVNRMQAQRTRLISGVRARGAVIEEHASSTAVWLRTALHLGDGVAQLRAATVTEVMPAVAAAYERGDFGLEHVEVIASAARDFRPGALARADQRFAVEAARLTPDGLRRAAARIREEYSPRTQ